MFKIWFLNSQSKKLNLQDHLIILYLKKTTFLLKMNRGYALSDDRIEIIRGFS